MQCILKCAQQLSAKLVITHSTTEFLTLLAFGTNMPDIAGNADVIAQLLLEAPPFTLTYDNNVITSIGGLDSDSVCLNISAICVCILSYHILSFILMIYLPPPMYLACSFKFYTTGKFDGFQSIILHITSKLTGTYVHVQTTKLMFLAHAPNKHLFLPNSI